MTIYTLLLYVAIAAAVLTGIVGGVFKQHKSWLMTYAQLFCGALFIFSGFVKAVDPLGTAFKMEQYFAEFFYTFKDTALSFIAPVFPWFSEHSVVFSIVMIVFEILLGAMLMLGSKPKLTSWLFFGLVAFFTVLTGFTFLTGYVPSGANFFEFGKWGAYVKTNMRVTDCGCFGDFLKLKPKVSFYKDVFLLVPSIYFLLRHRDMHQLFSTNVRTILIGLVTLGFTAFCWRNTFMDEPVFDFRPFRAGVDVRGVKAKEAEEEADAFTVTAYKLKNKASGQVVTLPIDQYTKEYKNYPKEEWEMEQVQKNPDYEHSKISEFEITAANGNSMTDALLNDTGYFLMVVAYKLQTLDGKELREVTVNDTIFSVDTVKIEGTDSFQLVKSVKELVPKQVQQEVTAFDPAYVERFNKAINPVMDAAKGSGIKLFAATAPNDPAVIEDFRHESQSSYPFFTADDLLLKTIQRSNPGLVLWKDGKILAKWHYKNMPTFEQIKAQYVK